MKQTVSYYILSRLLDWDVRRIYGYPGDGINGFMGSLDDLSDDLQFIQRGPEIQQSRQVSNPSEHLVGRLVDSLR